MKRLLLLLFLLILVIITSCASSPTQTFPPPMTPEATTPSFSTYSSINTEDVLRERATQWSNLLLSVSTGNQEDLVGEIEGFLEESAAREERAQELYASWKSQSPIISSSIDDVQISADDRHGTVRYSLVVKNNDGSKDVASETTNWILVNGTWYRTMETSQITLVSKGTPTSTTTTTPVITPTPTLTAGFSRSNPVGTNVPLTTKVGSSGRVGFDDKYTVRVTLLEFIRGNTAWQMISEANMFNSEPKSGYEYILVKIRLEYLEGPTTDTIYEATGVWFTVVSMDGKDYDNSLIVDPEPKFDASLYPGASTEGWVAFSISLSDSKPLLTFARGFDGTGGIWFTLY